MGPFREHARAPAADLCFQISAGAGDGDSPGPGACRSADRRSLAQLRSGVRGYLLDAAGLGSSALGAARKLVGIVTSADGGLEPQLLGRLGGFARRDFGSRRDAPNRDTTVFGWHAFAAPGDELDAISTNCGRESMAPRSSR